MEKMALGFILFCIAVLAWYFQFNLRRRRVYELASAIPGPPGLPIIGNVLQYAIDPVVFLKKLEELTQTYPNIAKCWFGPKLIFTMYNPEYIKLLLNNQNSLQKADLFYKFLIPPMGTGVVTAPVSKWKHHRKTINPYFNQNVLNKLLDIFVRQSERLVDALAEFVEGTEFDMDDALRTMTMDTVQEIVLGTKSQMDLNITHHTLAKCSNAVASRMIVFWYHIDFIYNCTEMARESQETCNRFQRFATDAIKQKRKERMECDSENINPDNGKCKALLDLFLDSDFTDEEINEEIRTFILGGSDTVSLTAGFLFLMLGMHPDIQEKIYEELTEVIGSNKKIELEHLHALKYTECAIKETLRLFPAFPCISRTLEEDLALPDGLTLPKDSSVIVAIYSIHRMTKYWHNPLEFNPDRFLPEETAERHPYCFIPFSGGARNCIGNKYGMMILKIMVVCVLGRYKISAKFKSIEDIKLTYQVTLGSEDGFIVSLKHRGQGIMANQ